MATVSEDEFRRRLGDVQEKFAEAREELEEATASEETIYFDDDVQVAKECVVDALSAYEGLLSDLDDARRGEVARANGQKMKQLKQELAMLGIDLDNPDDHNA